MNKSESKLSTFLNTYFVICRFFSQPIQVYIWVSGSIFNNIVAFLETFRGVLMYLFRALINTLQRLPGKRSVLDCRVSVCIDNGHLSEAFKSTEQLTGPLLRLELLWPTCRSAVSQEAHRFCSTALVLQR